MLTADHEYSCSNTDQLPLPVQMQLLKKLKLFSWFFIGFSESQLNFEQFEKEDKPHSSIIFEIINSQRGVYLQA